MNGYLRWFLIFIVFIAFVTIIWALISWATCDNLWCVKDNPGIDCPLTIDKSVCQGAGEICKNDLGKDRGSCGDCSLSEHLLEDDCSDNDGSWISNMSSCYWVQPDPLDINDPPLEHCVYDLNKCEGVCDTFSPTNLFGDCCGTDNWEKFMDERTLVSIEDENKKDDGHVGSGGVRGELEATYNLRRASSEEFSRRREINQGVYE